MLSSILGEERKAIRVDAQCVRSASFWSCGTRTIEHSIQNAYIHMIDSAQHFIYIEVISKHFLFFKNENENNFRINFLFQLLMMQQLKMVLVMHFIVGLFGLILIEKNFEFMLFYHYYRDFRMLMLFKQFFILL
jgi:hypothetical protein